MVWLFYTTNISVDLAHHEIFHVKDGKGGIKCIGFIVNIRVNMRFCYLLGDQGIVKRACKPAQSCQDNV